MSIAIGSRVVVLGFMGGLKVLRGAVGATMGGTFPFLLIFLFFRRHWLSSLDAILHHSSKVAGIGF